MFKPLLPLLLALFGFTGLSAQKTFTFTPLAADTERPDGKTVLLDIDRLLADVLDAPDQYSGQKSTTNLELPLPDGTYLTYRVYNADLLPNRPKLGSYRVVSPFGTGRIATSPGEISGLIQGPSGYFVITPIDAATGLYQVLTYADYVNQNGATGGGACGFDDATLGADGQPHFDELDLGAGAGAGLGRTKAAGVPRELRVYDLIMTNTGEFGARIGGTEEAVMNAFNTAASTVNAILEPQIGITLNLKDEPRTIYLDAGADPFRDADDGRGLLGQVIDAFETNSIPSSDYDLGHILTNRCIDNLGGVVSGQACTNGKTRGVTCVGGSVFNSALRIMAHEIAHQFAVSHTWNNCPNVQNQRAGTTAYEPGAGNSIMSYARSCGDQNVGAESAYYHYASIEQFNAFTRNGGRGDACATVIQTNNITPDVTLDYADDLTIPISTPFRLEGSATDDNGDDLRYNWEQYDLFVAATDIRSPRESAPLFQSVPPTEEGFVRYFPNLPRVVNNIRQFEEVLPDYARELTFRFTAHDYNEEAGGTDSETVSFQVTDQAGPFVVNNPPNTVWTAGSFQEVTWEVAGTDEAPVNVRSVNILLSTDNGRNFDRVLAAGVANSGSASVTVPEGLTTSNARIMIEAADNIFFNVNPRRFDVVNATEPGYTLQTSTSFEEVCLPDVLSIDLFTGSILGFDEAIRVEVDRENLPEGTEATLTNSVVTPGEGTNLTVDFTGVNFTGVLPLTILGITNGTDTARREVILDIQDNDYSDLVLETPTEGEPGIVLGANFDWTDAVNADRYQIQIATSSTFSEESIYEEELGLEESEYTPGLFFEPNTIYFWRVRAINRCGFGEWRDVRSFKTVSSDCTEYTYDGETVTLPNGAVTRSATIQVDQEGTINDLNVPRISIRFPFISNLRVSIVSPGGKRVRVYDQNCRISSNIFRAGYDDDALERLECGSQQTRVVTPTGDLSDFNGDQIRGEWKLEVETTRGGSGTGAIIDWAIEFCTDATVDPPTQVRNDDSEVPAMGAVTIGPDKLEVTSENNNALEIDYQIINTPDFGELLLYGQPLAVGETFRQADVNGGGLSYREMDGTNPFDDFGFIVTTADGGYLPIDYHTILIGEPLSTGGPAGGGVESSLIVFPNPTDGDWHLRWSARLAREVEVALFDLNGRRLRRARVDGTAGVARVAGDGLPSGIYLLRVDGAVRRVIKR